MAGLAATAAKAPGPPGAPGAAGAAGAQDASLAPPAGAALAPAERPGALAQRVVSGVAIAVPVLAGAVLGGPWFLFGTALLGALGLREFFALAARSGAHLIPGLGYALGFGLLLANGGIELLRAAPGPVGALLPDASATALATRLAGTATVLLPLLALLFDRRAARGTQGRLAGWALTLAGTFYVAWLLSHFQTLRLVGPPGSEAGRGWVLFVFAATWSYDTGAYLVGRRFGRRRFMTWISPSKTWEGAAGGLACCLLATLVARAPAPPVLAALAGWAPLPIPLWHVPWLALAVCAAAQLGDLAESLIKREAGAKDASALIPGHGGMLDRMDSLLCSVVLVYYYVVLVLGLG